MRTDDRAAGARHLWVLLVFVLFGLLAYGGYHLQQPQTQQLELDLGRSIAQIEARSTYRFDPRHTPLAIDIYTVSNPVVITVATAGCPVTFPAAKYAALDVNGGKLENYDFSPHLRYLSFDEATTLHQKLDEAIEKAGWKRDPTAHAPAATQIPTLLNEVSEGRKIDLGGWLCSGQVMQLQLQRQYKAGTPSAARSELKGDSYILTVSVTTPV